MRFTRIAFFILGGIGLSLGLLAGIGGKSWTLGLLLGALLGIPLWLALLKVPKRWMVWRETAPGGQELYRRYTRLDYAVLAAMLVGVLPVIWLVPLLPASFAKNFGTSVLLAGALLALVSNAYSWQLKTSARSTLRSKLIAYGVLMAFGILIAWDPDELGGSGGIYAFGMIYIGFWGIARAVVQHMLERSEPAVVGAVISAPSVVSPAKPVLSAANKGVFRILPVTSTIIVVLGAVFTLEVLANIGSLGPLLSPSLYTLVGFGGLYQPELLQDHQWYRLMAPALLHASLLHLFFNCYALLLIGMFLENFLGRAWYLAIFVLGSVGGALMSLAINPPQLISVGASGAIMALFGAALATSLRRPDPAARKALQKWLIQVLVLSLLPFISVGGGRIDIAAHLGGVITGGLVGLLLWAVWDETAKKPRLQELAMAISALGIAGFAYTAVPAMQHYPEYVQEAKLHPIATSQEERQARQAAEGAAQRGWGYEKQNDYAQALSWYQKGATGGDAYSQTALGRFYEYSMGVPQNYAQAMKWYGLAAQQGYPEAEARLGTIYRYGLLGTTQNLYLARDWFGKSAEQGYDWGEDGLAEMYRHGVGVPQDYAKALELYRKSAAQNDAQGEWQLGEMYDEGSGIPQDFAQARALYEKAAQQGQVEGQNLLGRMYLQGRGTGKDYAQAFKWYSASAAQDNSVGEDNVGYLYSNGFGTGRDYTQARQWFEKAADQGDMYAEYSLSSMYALGEGVPRDYAQALKWAKQSADQDDMDAEVYLGYAYEHGLGVPIDPAQAAKWYTLAAKQGSEMAKAALSRLGAPVP